MNLYKFFDHFGIIVFIFLAIDSVYDLKTSRKNLRTWIRLIIGIGGFLIDGYLVFFYSF
ncbi:MAG: hypothetical protein AAB890_00820 [Patescibacteria group bacterium]